MEKHDPKAGFTLIDLIAVIVVLAICTSLIISFNSSCSDARHFNKQISCLYNLHETAKFAVMYSDEHNGWFPFSRGRENPPAYASLQLLADWAGDMTPEHFIYTASQDKPASIDRESYRCRRSRRG